MGKVIWINSAQSGLCDRLMDVFLMASYAKILNCELYLSWMVQPINDEQKKIWNEVRFEDYKYENFNQYFCLPEIIKIVPPNELIHDGAIIFSHYLGGVYNPRSFFQKFLADKDITFEQFQSVYYELFNQFRPTEKLLNIVSGIERPDIAIHLRRTDKVCNNPDEVQINRNNLDDLDTITINTVNKLITKYDRKVNIFICSDDDNAKLSYQTIYNKNNIIDYKTDVLIEKTYIDLYLLSISDNILMSQKHSNFSLFSSLINKKKLIYLFNNNSIIGDNNFENTVFYELV
jgi:hypothetical protein